MGKNNGWIKYILKICSNKMFIIYLKKNHRQLSRHYFEKKDTSNLKNRVQETDLFRKSKSQVKSSQSHDFDFLFLPKNFIFKIKIEHPKIFRIVKLVVS